MNDKLTTIEMVGSLSILGVLISVGQLLASKEVLTPRIIAGRALSSLGVSLGAGAVLLQFPDIPPLALIGIGAVVSSLGTSFIEKFVQKKLGIAP